jgi:hypothetical protein
MQNAVKVVRITAFCIQTATDRLGNRPEALLLALKIADGEP